MHTLRTAAILVALLVSGGAVAVATTPGGDDDDDAHGHWAAAKLVDAQGGRVGTVTFRERHGDVVVRAAVWNMPPGFHGFHVHAVGACEPPGFTSALGHLRAEGQQHGDHIGDLPVLLVKQDGTGRLVAHSDRFGLGDLRDADGSAVIVHALPDNYANIPERYAPAPDAQTKETGDAGARIACGAVG